MDLAYMGEMHWDKPLEKPGTNISLIPYTLASAFRDYSGVNRAIFTGYPLNVARQRDLAIEAGFPADLAVLETRATDVAVLIQPFKDFFRDHGNFFRRDRGGAPWVGVFLGGNRGWKY